jgi:16S rRNA (guanine1207-N2)-methyltransferase
VTLERHHQLTPFALAGRRVYSKPGVRHYPELTPAAHLFASARGWEAEGLIDATGSAGAVALLTLAEGDRAERDAPSVLEPSMAALRCARATFSAGDARVSSGLPWDLPSAGVSRLALAPAGDKGNARVVAEIEAAARALRGDGVLYVALDKDQGAKRYQRALAGLFRDVAIIRKQRGWRLLRATGPAGGGAGSEPWLAFEAADLSLEALPGVHAAGRLDPGTEVLLGTVPWSRLAGRRVLDLGCGVGVIALVAARAGANVMAVDDDLAAVRSATRSAERSGLPLEVRHSDVDSELVGERFDVVLTNPPFHVGRGVRLDLPEAFIEASRRLLVPGGELWLVANRGLPYERRMGEWPEVELAADEGGFKVIRARR